MINQASAIELAKRLSAKYSVPVEVIETDAEYYAEQAIQESAKHERYFVSAETPEATALTTEQLIRFAHLKELNRMDSVRDKLIQKADRTALRLGEKIAEIKEAYRATHQDKGPNLNQIAAILNEEKIESPGKGREWYAGTVKRIVDRSTAQQR